MGGWAGPVEGAEVLRLLGEAGATASDATRSLTFATAVAPASWGRLRRRCRRGPRRGRPWAFALRTSASGAGGVVLTAPRQRLALLADLALDARAGALDLALELVARGGAAAALEAAQVGLERALGLAQLALGLLARAVGGAQLVHGADDVVARRQCGADGGQDGLLGDVANAVDRRAGLALGGALRPGGAGLRGAGGAAGRALGLRGRAPGSCVVVRLFWRVAAAFLAVVERLVAAALRCVAAALL